MKKIVCLSLVLIIVISVLSVSVLSYFFSDHPIKENTDRFIKVYSNFTNKIFVDTETNVLYFWHCGGYSGGLSVMLDENGKPLLWEKTN